MWRHVCLVVAAALAACESRGPQAGTVAADSTGSVFLPPLPPPAPQGPPHFSYAGLSVPETFDSLAARYPTSPKRNFVIDLAAAEVHDRITQVAYGEDAGGWKRISISFERFPGLIRPEPARTRYPRCEQILRGITARFGEPDSLRQFADQAHARMDRYWSRDGEMMVLLCILDAGGVYARALTMERSPGE